MNEILATQLFELYKEDGLSFEYITNNILKNQMDIEEVRKMVSYGRELKYNQKGIKC